ncbi:MAG: hypothetical protein K2X35_25635 [Bryobacteraceae bacterium]|nr:hypothetical protein [Bryobacteraceae bacterium]
MADLSKLPPVAEFQADIDFDRSEPQTRGIFVFTVATVLFLVLTMAGIGWFFGDKFMAVYEREVLEAGSEVFDQVRARDTRNLTTYGYVDESKGKVRIPIDRAMELLAAEAAAGKLPYPAKPTEVKPGDDPAAPAPAEAAKAAPAEKH